MKPDFEIFADGNKVTPVFKQNLISINISDESGEQSDKCDIVVDDSQRLIKTPQRGAELEVWLGYEGMLRKMGVYVVDEVEIEGLPDKIKIKASGAPFTKSAQYKELQSRKQRSWEPLPIADLVKTIAAEHGLKPIVGVDLANIEIPHTDQTDESDMHLLTRIARDYDAVAKPTFGKLIFVKRGQGKKAQGDLIPTVRLTPEEVSRWSVKLQEKSKFKSVVASWYDSGAAELIEEPVGDEEPTYRIKNQFPDQASARTAAEARFKLFNRSGSQVALSMAGRPDLIAEGRLLLDSFRAEINGEWVIRNVTHSLSINGYTVSVKAEVGA